MNKIPLSKLDGRYVKDVVVYDEILHVTYTDGQTDNLLLDTAPQSTPRILVRGVDSPENTLPAEAGDALPVVVSMDAADASVDRVFYTVDESDPAEANQNILAYALDGDSSSISSMIQLPNDGKVHTLRFYLGYYPVGSQELQTVFSEYEVGSLSGKYFLINGVRSLTHISGSDAVFTLHNVDNPKAVSIRIGSLTPEKVSLDFKTGLVGFTYSDFLSGFLTEADVTVAVIVDGTTLEAAKIHVKPNPYRLSIEGETNELNIVPGQLCLIRIENSEGHSTILDVGDVIEYQDSAAFVRYVSLYPKSSGEKVAVARIGSGTGINDLPTNAIAINVNPTTVNLTIDGSIEAQYAQKPLKLLVSGCVAGDAYTLLVKSPNDYDGSTLEINTSRGPFIPASLTDSIEFSAEHGHVYYLQVRLSNGTLSNVVKVIA